MITDPGAFQFERGQKLTAAQVESLRQAIIRATPSALGHVGAQIKSTPDGWNIIVKQQPKQGRVDARKPLHVYRNVKEGTNFISIVPGVFSGVVPTLSGDPITDDPPPAIEINSSITKIWIEAEWDLVNQSVDECKIDGGNEVPNNTSTFSYLQIASIEWNTEASPDVIQSISNLYTGSIAAAISGDAEVLFIGVL